MVSISSDYKKRAKRLIESVSEFKADLPDILAQLEEIRMACMQGMESEKINQRLEEGKTTVLEVFPQVALQAVMGKLAVYKEISRLAEMEEIDPEISIAINLMSLEEKLGQQ